MGVHDLFGFELKVIAHHNDKDEHRDRLDNIVSIDISIQILQYKRDGYL